MTIISIRINRPILYRAASDRWTTVRTVRAYARTGSADPPGHFEPPDLELGFLAKIIRKPLSAFISGHSWLYYLPVLK